MHRSKQHSKHWTGRISIRLGEIAQCLLQRGLFALGLLLLISGNALAREAKGWFGATPSSAKVRDQGAQVDLLIIDGGEAPPRCIHYFVGTRSGNAGDPRGMFTINGDAGSSIL
jgi:hypothetical protein